MTNEPTTAQGQGEAPDVLGIVNGLLSEAADLLSEAHSPAREEKDAELLALGFISQAGQVVVRERSRRERGGEGPIRPGMAPEQETLWDARAEEEAWGLAWSILYPWVESARYIGSDELTQVMEKALEEVDSRVNAAMDKREKAEAELERGGEK